MNKEQKIYNGNVEINNSNAKEWENTLKNYKGISGYLYINSDVKLSALKSVGGYLYIYSDVNLKTEKQLWTNNKKNKWFLTNNSSEFLLSKKGAIKYKINNVNFEKKLFDAVRKDNLTAQEVFKIDNIEQRRIAYEFMNKIKMQELGGYKVIHKTAKDKHGYSMKLIEFNIDDFDSPFRFLNCFCPSEGREYFLETQQDTCQKAKAMSFGINDNIKFMEEW